MFDRIAGVYDVMNSAMTAGLHHRWRARAAELAMVGPGSRALDVATGTGDLALVPTARAFRRPALMWAPEVLITSNSICASPATVPTTAGAEPL